MGSKRIDIFNAWVYKNMYTKGLAPGKLVDDYTVCIHVGSFCLSTEPV